MQALLRRGEEGVGTPVGARGAESAAEPSPSDLGGLGAGEVDTHGEPPGQHERAARGVVAQGHQLEGEGLVLTLEALAAEARLHAGEDAAGEAELGFAPARLHRAVPGDDGLRVADGGGDESGEEAVLARLDGADAGLAAHDAVEAGALQGQRRRQRVGERVEAGEESADASGSVAGGEEAAGLELDEGGARRAGEDAEGRGRGVAVGLAGVGGRRAELGQSPRGAGGQRTSSRPPSRYRCRSRRLREAQEVVARQWSRGPRTPGRGRSRRTSCPRPRDGRSSACRSRGPSRARRSCCPRRRSPSPGISEEVRRVHGPSADSAALDVEAEVVHLRPRPPRRDPPPRPKAAPRTTPASPPSSPPYSSAPMSQAAPAGRDCSSMSKRASASVRSAPPSIGSLGVLRWRSPAGKFTKLTVPPETGPPGMMLWRVAEESDERLRWLAALTSAQPSTGSLSGKSKSSAAPPGSSRCCWRGGRATGCSRRRRHP